MNSVAPRILNFVASPLTRAIIPMKLTTTIRKNLMDMPGQRNKLNSGSPTLLKRRFSVLPPSDKNSRSRKAVMIRGKSENREGQLRVRRARPADTPVILRFVRENAQYTWSGSTVPRPAATTSVILADCISRTLAQGHTLLAEQQDPSRGVRKLSGLALVAAICTWDVSLLEQWASCVKCKHSRSLLRFTAHCLKEPRLHEKYMVDRILQVLLIVPESPKASDISLLLAKNIIKRGKDSGYQIMRFDVTDDKTAETMEKLKLKKEWQFPTELKKDDTMNATPRCIKVYSAQGSSFTFETPKPVKTTPPQKNSETIKKL